MFVRGLPVYDLPTILQPKLQAALRLSVPPSIDYIVTAIDLVERYTNRLMVECEIEGRFIRAHPNTLSKYQAVHFPFAPIYDDAFVSVAFKGDAVDGTAIQYMSQCLVFLNMPTCFCPDLTESGQVYNVIAKIKAGYKEGKNPLLDAIVKMAAYLYDNQIDCGSCTCTSVMPQSIKMMLNPYVIRRVY